MHRRTLLKAELYLLFHRILVEEQVVLIEKFREVVRAHLDVHVSLFLLAEVQQFGNQLLQLLAVLVDEVADDDDDEINQVMQKVRTEFNIIDIQALSSEENWWSIILEQIELGVM